MKTNHKDLKQIDAQSILHPATNANDFANTCLLYTSDAAEIYAV